MCNFNTTINLWISKVRKIMSLYCVLIGILIFISYTNNFGKLFWRFEALELILGIFVVEIIWQHCVVNIVIDISNFSYDISTTKSDSVIGFCNIHSFYLLFRWFHIHEFLCTIYQFISILSNLFPFSSVDVSFIL